ncbi:MAG: fatty acid desaturase [Hyphomicrobium sp.]
MHQTSIRAQSTLEKNKIILSPQSQNLAKTLAPFKSSVAELASHCAKFRGAKNRSALVQLFNTIFCLACILTLMFWTVEKNYFLTMLIGIPCGLLLVRFFIIQHDCGHNSFFSSPTVNTNVGRLISLLTFTPFGLWKREHAQHHATSGHLDKRGVGDIETLTVSEWEKLPPLRKLGYKIYRNPLFLFGIGVPFYFLILQRLPWFHAYPARETWKSVLGLNLCLTVFYGSLGLFLGFSNLFLVMWPLVHVASAVGGWLFFIQHQFEDTVWEKHENWNFQVAALYGSSYYKLHPILNWFTGSIGLHHIHHLNSMIPNYRLKECLEESPALQSLNKITFKESLKCAKLKLWDEKNRKLVTFAEVN